MNFRGVALGDSWISAMDYVNTWGEYLYANLEFNHLGTERWMNRLTWPGFQQFKQSDKIPFSTKSFRLAGYRKRYRNLSFYSILRAGHMVAYDAPEASLYMLRRILNDYN
uniref:Serine carboxypeptidase n=1 Tax=Heterorhabditis bacteriophora TaxID=37862 RepID=A0A1I7X0U8_HETBA